MLSDAQLWVSAKEVLAREMTWMTAERTRRGHPRGRGREWDRAIEGMGRLPEKCMGCGLREGIRPIKFGGPPQPPEGIQG